MTVHLWGKTSFKMPKLNLELFKNLTLNFAYIHSKRKKQGMSTFYQKRQFIYRNKVIINSPPSPISFMFNFWSSGMLRGYNETLMHKKTWRTTSSPGRFSLALEVCPTSEAREKRPGNEVTWRFTFGGKFILC